MCDITAVDVTLVIPLELMLSVLHVSLFTDHPQLERQFKVDRESWGLRTLMLIVLYLGAMTQKHEVPST